MSRGELTLLLTLPKPGRAVTVPATFACQTIDEAIAKANDTRFGLAAYVMTNDLSAAFKMAEGLEFGTIGINDTVPASPQLPFGGIKESGIGRENAIEGLDVYLETKAVSLAIKE